MSLYCAIDLHSTNNVPVVIDDDDTVLFEKRLPNDLSTVIAALKPFKQDLHGVAVESTFNWYWLVDGLADNDFNTLLVNPSAVKQYEGIKHTNDESDAFHRQSEPPSLCCRAKDLKTRLILLDPLFRSTCFYSLISNTNVLPRPGIMPHQ